MNQLVVQSNQGLPSEHEMMVFHTMAEQAVNSKMYKGIGDQAGVMMIMLAARELGIPAMQALNGGLNIIQGKVEISARMMSALIRKSGHHISIKVSTDEKCVLIGKRCDTGEFLETTFTIADAQKAGIFKTGGGWTKWPKDMCFARALSRLSRQLFSDVIGIGYVEGEIMATEAKIDLPEPVEIVSDPKSEENELQQVLDLFDHEDGELVLEYIEVVSKHFGWSKAECVKNFLSTENVKEKFQQWKTKRVK